MKRFSLQITKKIIFDQYILTKLNSAAPNICHIFKRYKSSDQSSTIPARKIFSGIQPSGSLHLGNYLGAVQNWVKLQNENENVTICIADLHSITLPQSPPTLRENIYEMAATLLACDIDPDKSTLFVQSTLQEHAELCWILGCAITMGRLGQLPQFKDKVKTSKDIPLGIFMYPILQAADILLHKATHVPVGDDQVQHIQLTQHIAKVFNNRYGATFPLCDILTGSPQGSRVRSLRLPSKKMSKSDADTRATIYIKDEPDVIVDKIKKAVTDFMSDVSYDSVLRPGVSNLIAIHSMVTGTSIKDIVMESKTINTGQYKMRVADAVVEHLKPLRNKIEYYMRHRTELIQILEAGADKARDQAEYTLAEVKQKLGLGINGPAPAEIPAFLKEKEQEHTPAVHQEVNIPKIHPINMEAKTELPIVPIQKIRMEKKYATSFDRLAPQFEANNLLPLNRPPITPRQPNTNNPTGAVAAAITSAAATTTAAATIATATTTPAPVVAEGTDCVLATQNPNSQFTAISTNNVKTDVIPTNKESERST